MIRFHLHIRSVGVRLMSLHQGNQTTAAYATEFCTLAAESGWNEAGLRSAFRLSEYIKDELVRDKPATVDELIALAIDVDERICERRRERACPQTSSSRPQDPAPFFSLSTTTSPPRHGSREGAEDNPGLVSLLWGEGTPTRCLSRSASPALPKAGAHP